MPDEQLGTTADRLPLDARWDERLLYFLNHVEIPAWLIIGTLLIFLIQVWLRTASAQIESYIGQVIAAMLTAVVINRNRRPNVDNSINAEVLKTPELTTQSMDKASITTGTVKMETPPK